MPQELFRKLLTRSEKLLIPLGVWPTTWNRWIIIFNVLVLSIYSFLVLIKNLKNPEQESVENAFTLANGGLITVVYFITMLLKKDKCIELYEHIKGEHRIAITIEEKKVVVDVGKEFQRISTAFLYFLPSAVLVRFLMPTAEYVYIQVLLIYFKKNI